MVNTEINYNPYTGETSIAFNNQPPRINSQVEKYHGSVLQDWIDEIPFIFRDEMNGYDFELHFSGTELDYSELKKSFEKAGALDRIAPFFKNELDSREQKLSDLKSLFIWLEENPNHKFDFSEFKKENSEIIEGAYTFITVNGGSIDTSILKDRNVTIENIEEIHELEGTDLTNIPIIFYIASEPFDHFQSALQYVIRLKQIKHRQLFFLLGPTLKGTPKERLLRIIRDVGVANPNTVNHIDAPEIMTFFLQYPVTDYIRNSIILLKEITSRLNSIQQVENKKNELSNGKITSKIKSIEASVDRLKQANMHFINPDNLDIPESWEEDKMALLRKINTWRDRKVKCSSDDAMRVVCEFTDDLALFYKRFLDDFRLHVAVSKKNLAAKMSSYFKEADVGSAYHLDYIEGTFVSEVVPPALTEGLLELKDERKIAPGNNVIGYLFGTQSETTEPTIETYYLYQKWRNYAAQVYADLIDNLIQEHYKAMLNSYEQMLNTYKNQIVSMIVNYEKEKASYISQLSGDAMIIQNDNDWLHQFIDQITHIERD